MSKSLLQEDTSRCYLCGRQYGLEKHHIFAGTANRKLSEVHNLWIMLCHNCHIGKDGAQYNKEKSIFLKQEAQKAFEKTHTREEFRNIFGKSYL